MLYNGCVESDVSLEKFYRPVSRVALHFSPSPPGPVFCGQCCFRLPILLLMHELRDVVKLPAVDDVVSFAGVDDAEGGSFGIILG